MVIFIHINIPFYNKKSASGGFSKNPSLHTFVFILAVFSSVRVHGHDDGIPFKKLFSLLLDQTVYLTVKCIRGFSVLPHIHVIFTVF